MNEPRSAGLRCSKQVLNLGLEADPVKNAPTLEKQSNSCGGNFLQIVKIHALKIHKEVRAFRVASPLTTAIMAICWALYQQDNLKSVNARKTLRKIRRPVLGSRSSAKLLVDS